MKRRKQRTNCHFDVAGFVDHGDSFVVIDLFVEMWGQDHHPFFSRLDDETVYYAYWEEEDNYEGVAGGSETFNLCRFNPVLKQLPVLELLLFF